MTSAAVDQQRTFGVDSVTPAVIDVQM